MKKLLGSLRVPPGKTIDLRKDYNPGCTDDFLSKEDAEELTAASQRYEIELTGDGKQGLEGEQLKDAIRAAIYPAQTDYQFFSAKCGGGGNFYTRTFEEFKQGLQCQ